MKRVFRVWIVLTLILGVSSIFMAFERADEPDVVIVGNIPTEFTVMQNDYAVYIDVIDKGYYLKNTKTGETKNISKIRILPQKELGIHSIKAHAIEQYTLIESFDKEYNATVTVVPFDPKLTISLPNVIKPDKWWTTGSVSSDDLKQHKVYIYNAVGNPIKGTVKDNIKTYWGYNKINTVFIPENQKYEETPLPLVIFHKFSIDIPTLPDRIFIPTHARMNQKTLQARINGGKWRSIKETNKLKLKPNTKYKVEIRQKAESFHKAVILQTSYVKTKKSY